MDHSIQVFGHDVDLEKISFNYEKKLEKIKSILDQ